MANNFLMQFQSDILGTRVERPEVREVTALGAAYLAGLAVGFWQNLDELQEKAVIEREFRPGIETTERNYRYAGWKKRSNARWHGKNTTSNNDCLMRRLRVLSGLRVGYTSGITQTLKPCGATPHTSIIPPFPCATLRAIPYCLEFAMRRELAIEFSRVTESAALAGYKWLGRGDKTPRTARR